MLLHCRIILRGLLALLILGPGGCGDDTVVVTDSATTTAPPTTTTGIPTTGESESGTGETTGSEVCELPQKACSHVNDCCEGGAFGGCPGLDYPHNWSCVDGFCEHGGCSGDTDCTNVIPGFECHSILGVGQCVAPCVSNADCDAIFKMGSLECSGVSSRGGFCQ